jgi:hypothetical protein
LAVDQRYYVVEDIATGSTVFDRQNSAFSFEIFGELLHFEAAGPTRTTIEILDLSGKLVHSTVHELPKGSSILAMPVGLSLGVYLIRIHDGCGSMYTKVYMD